MTQAMGFRAGCREQAGLAMAAFARFWSRYAPKSGKRNVVRGGCLILMPFITLTVWFLQAVVWMMVSAPILAYALVMATMGGGFKR